MTPTSLVHSPSPGSLLLQTDPGALSSVFSGPMSVPACRQQSTNECLLNKQINGDVFAYKIQHNTLLKNSICHELCKCTTV